MLGPCFLYFQSFYICYHCSASEWSFSIQAFQMAKVLYNYKETSLESASELQKWHPTVTVCLEFLDLDVSLRFVEAALVVLVFNVCFISLQFLMMCSIHVH